MSMERQRIYGWPIAFDLFLGGVGAGAFLVGFVLNFLKTKEPIAKIGIIIGPFLVLGGAIFLLADVAIRRRIYRLFSNFKSWTSRGSWILTFFIVLGFTYLLISLRPFTWLSWMNIPTLSGVIGVITALFSILVLIYPGFLIGTINAIPFWNTPILPLLFFFSGLSNGIAVLILATPLFQVTLKNDIVEVIHLLGGAVLILIFLQILTLYAFLEIASHGNVASKESLRLLEASQFKLKMFALGLLIPFGLLLYGISINEVFFLSILSMFASILLLAGGFYLRYAIIHVGVFLPRFSI